MRSLQYDYSWHAGWAGLHSFQQETRPDQTKYLKLDWNYCIDLYLPISIFVASVYCSLPTLLFLCLPAFFLGSFLQNKTRQDVETRVQYSSTKSHLCMPCYAMLESNLIIAATKQYVGMFLESSEHRFVSLRFGPLHLSDPLLVSFPGR